jgi:hypothetical protein
MFYLPGVVGIAKTMIKDFQISMLSGLKRKSPSQQMELKIDEFIKILNILDPYKLEILPANFM